MRLNLKQNSFSLVKLFLVFDYAQTDIQLYLCAAVISTEACRFFIGSGMERSNWLDFTAPLHPIVSGPLEKMTIRERLLRRLKKPSRNDGLVGNAPALRHPQNAQHHSLHLNPFNQHF